MSILKNILKISTGTLFAQILMLIGTPIITGLYEKEVIGIYALFISTLNVTTSFVTLAYDNTIVLPSRKDDAQALLKITLISGGVLSIVTSITLYIPIEFFVKYKEIIFFIGLGTFLQVVINSLNYSKIRDDLFTKLSKSKVLRSIIILAFQIGLFSLGSYGLLLGFIVASFCVIIYLMYKDKNILTGVFKYQNKQILFKNAIRYKEYPKYFCWSNLIFAISSSLPILIFSEYFSLSQVAIYSVASSIMIQPASLISSSIRPVLLSEMAKKKGNKESILFLHNKTFYILFFLGVILSIVIYFILPKIVIFIFGEKWTESAYMVRFLIPYFIWFFVSIPSSIATKVYPFQKYALFFTISSLFIKLCLILIIIYFEYKFNDVVLIFSLGSLSIDLFNHFIVRKLIVKEELRILNL